MKILPSLWILRHLIKSHAQIAQELTKIREILESSYGPVSRTIEEYGPPDDDDLSYATDQRTWEAAERAKRKKPRYEED